MVSLFLKLEFLNHYIRDHLLLYNQYNFGHKNKRRLHYDFYQDELFHTLQFQLHSSVNWVIKSCFVESKNLEFSIQYKSKRISSMCLGRLVTLRHAILLPSTLRALELLDMRVALLTLSGFSCGFGFVRGPVQWGRPVRRCVRGGKCPFW